MTDYPRIIHTLQFFAFSGLSEQGNRELLERQLLVADWRVQIESELRQVFCDKSFQWAPCLYNSEYEVFESESEEEARDYAAEVLWNVVFPHIAVPDFD